MVNIVEVIVRTINDTKAGLDSAKKDFDKAGKDIAGSIKPVGIALGGAGGLALAAPIAAAGVAMGAFGAIAIPTIKETMKTIGKNATAQNQYNKTLDVAKQAYANQMAAAQQAYDVAKTGTQRQAALNKEHQAAAQYLAAQQRAQLKLKDSTVALSGDQKKLGSNIEQISSTFANLQQKMAPLVISITNLALKVVVDLMPALKVLATAGADVISGLLGPLDQLFKSSGFAKFTADLASFAKQAAPLIGTLLVGALQALMQLLEQLAPVGLQLLKTFTPIFLSAFSSAIPVVKVLAIALNALLKPISLLAPVLGPLAALIYGVNVAMKLWAATSMVTAGITKVVTSLLDFQVIALKAMYIWDGLVAVAVKGWAVVQAALDVALNANPIGAVIIALAAIAVGFRIAWEKSALFRDIIKDIAKVMLSAGIIIVEVNKQIVNAILVVIGTILHGLKDAFGWIPGGVGNALKSASAAFDRFHSGVNNTLDGIIGKMHGWDSALDASKNKAASATSSITRNYQNQLTATSNLTRFTDTLAGAIASLHSKNVAISMSGKGQFSLSEINANTGKQKQAAAGAYVTGGIAGRDSVPIMAMPGELVVPTNMVNAGAVDHLRGRIPGFANGGVVGNLSGNYVTGMYSSFQNKMTSAMVSAMRTALSHAEAAAVAAAKAASSSGAGVAGPGGGAPAANAALAKRLMPAWGSGAQWNAWNALAMGESGWNQFARNPSSGAYGIPQALPPGKMGAAANPPQSNPTAQINWMIGYIKNTPGYGDPIHTYSKWLSRSPHWYDSGGWLPTGTSIAVNNTGKPERVLGPHDTQAINLTIEGGESAFEQFMLKWIREHVRVKGGGNVQRAFGRGL